jgi:multidrug efflux pump subunit AcrA (membrane-fusion protein)
MSISDIFRINDLKKSLVQAQEERDLLKKELADYQQIKKERDALKKLLPETDLYCQLRSTISTLEKRKIEITQQVNNFEAAFTNKQQELKFIYETQEQELNKQIRDLNKQIMDNKEELVQLDEEILLQSFGFYKPKYVFENSEIYKIKLKQIREQQEALVKSEKAVYCTTNWSLNNSEKEGKRMIKDYVKLLLRSFNNECDASIINVKFNNINSIEKKLNKAFEILNNLGQRMNIVLSADYLNLKLSELYLCHEYQIKKQEEKEEQRRIRVQMREDAKVQKEIEEMKAKIEKEEKHFNNALQLVNNQLEKASTETEREVIKNELNVIKAKLEDVEKNKQDVLYREQNTRAGYVYVISNIGSFGENVYKIGVTRRLDPHERVDELGDASVPFYFDVHAMIFSDDAPSLENALHKAFDDRRLNRINLRREFFRVKLEEIETVVKNNFNKPVEFTKLAEAEQYRQSLILKENY